MGEACGSDDGATRRGLCETRRRIEALAGGGRFYVASADTGTEPVPVVGLRFPDRESAATAARLTAAYRATLRRWDPATAPTDPVVRERSEGGCAVVARPSTATTGGER
jgi:hypothetical protein